MPLRRKGELERAGAGSDVVRGVRGVELLACAFRSEARLRFGWVVDMGGGVEKCGGR